MTDEMLPPFPAGKAKLYWLMNLYVSGACEFQTFCSEFEQVYNFEVENTELSATEQSVFKDIFANVTMYSPYEDELKSIPIYRSADQIKKSVEEGRAKLQNRPLPKPK